MHILYVDISYIETIIYLPFQSRGLTVGGCLSAVKICLD